MLTKLKVPANSEVGPMAAIIGVTRGGSEEERESDSGATFHMPHTHAGMEVCKKASPRTAVEVADGSILPANGFGTTYLLDNRGGPEPIE